ncbi:MAG TPA: alpha/beta fold hydrolase, partial [Aliiroseovarius sp.]|nr:alpha/beta fold hydrolase [Aliiroseovarius sp.]
YEHSQSHLIRAMRKLDPARVASRAEADATLARDIETPELRAFLLQSLNLPEKRWQLNLDVLERDMDKITGWPDGLTGRFDGPVLFLSGANSDYVRPEHRDRIRALFPKARFARLPGAGHWLHAERPRAFIAAAQAFLNG